MVGAANPDHGGLLDEDEDSISLMALLGVIASRWKSIGSVGVLAGALGFGGAMLLPPVYTARTLVMPPQQQNSAASALSSLGALAGLAGGGVKNTADQYIALLQSTTVSDRIIDRFKLLTVYDEEFKIDARKKLAKNVAIVSGKKDGLIAVEAEDKDPRRAADLANAYIDELRYMTNTLAVSEAQQRRKFFEQRLEETKNKLTQAQVALQASGFNAGTLRAEPKAAAEGYARIRAEVTAAEVRLEAMRQMLTDRAPEVVQQQSIVSRLRAELARAEQKEPEGVDAGYIGRYRDYKYQETLFDLYAKQFEVARMDESREGALIQIVDVAQPPEKKSGPKRLMFALGAAVAAMLVMAIRAGATGMAALRPVPHSPAG